MTQDSSPLPISNHQTSRVFQSRGARRGAMPVPAALIGRLLVDRAPLLPGLHLFAAADLDPWRAESKRSEADGTAWPPRPL
ncbi:hypothetical protein BRADI_1g27482v3 [Brachypodium distachyon]|uniref:Uncharacterized protein n=1 Tax=Brachypodium distachyon TaxID=15368 RepID=A0A0Q3JVV7_BRADI|nr:hypothetical protein BRADI_1g27482v3 [Brachypodium distachyon]